MKKHIYQIFKINPIRIYLIFLLSLCTNVVNAQSVTWAFLKGFKDTTKTAVYGTMGVADPANLPGARHSSATWQIGSKLYVYGGGAINGLNAYFNDMWEYDTDTGNWRWIKGNSLTTYQAATYGTLGEPAEANSPGSRGNSVTWVSGGKLYLFGGHTYTSSNTQRLNDLWVFDPATGNWCWIKGSSSLNQNGYYGTIGVASALNTPGSRRSSVSWESGGKLYLFGGINNNASTGEAYHLNDLWVFDPATGNWSWIKGSSLANQTGTYGTLGVAEAANTPGPRYSSVSWESEGKLYLFGGNSGSGYFNDLWEYEIASGHWRWIKGSNLKNQFGTYGTRGTADADNKPGARHLSASWESGGKFYLFGGYGYTASNSGRLNDLWEYNPDTGYWRWIKGGNLPDKLGTLGSIEAANQPGTRDAAISWQAGGKLYLFGGVGFGLTGRSGLRGDLWSATFVSSSAALTNLTLSDGTLSPDFDSGTTNYSASVSISTASITVTPTVSDPTASVTVNGVTVTSGSASQAISLSGGSNTITTVVTAQDGETTKSYTLTVSKPLSTNANLAALAISSGTLDPGFDAATLSYAASVPFATSSVTITPTLAETNATVQVQVNGGGYTTVTSATASVALALNVGSNTIDVKVTAQDGTTSKTYTLTLSREKADQVITFNALSAKKYGDAAFELAATGGASGNPLVYVSRFPSVASISGNTVTIVGIGTTEITVSQEGNANYNAASDVEQTLIVFKGDQTINFPALQDKVYGDAAFDLTATGGASANPVTYVSSNTSVASVSGSTVTIVGVGTSNITASQEASGTYNAATPVVQTLTVTKANQTISFSALATKAFGDAAFELTATGGASTAVISYSSSNSEVATLSGNTVSIVGVGTTDITVSQGADARYNAATDVVQTLTVTKGNQTISFSALSNKTFGDAAFELNATPGASTAVISYSSSNSDVATLSGNTVSIVGVGTTDITVSQGADARYNAAAPVVQTLVVGKANQTISFNALAAKTFGDAAFNLTATGGASGNAVTYVSSDPAVATVSGSTITIVGTGTTNITASQAANVNYNAAADVIQSLTVAKAAQTITFAALPVKAFGDDAFNLTATGGASGNAVTYTSSNTAVATVSGSTITIVGTGTTNITASQAASANYNAAADVIQSLTVAKAAQTITFAALPAKTFGDAAFNLTATGGASGNAVTYVSSNTAVATVSGNTVTIVGSGTTEITASQAANANYNAATDVIQSITVAKAAQTITFAALTAKTFGDAAFNLTATGGASGNAVNFVSSNTAVATVNGSTVTITGAGTSNITASQAGNANFDAAADVVQTLRVLRTAELSGLTISSGTLSPAFSSAATNYSVSVGNNISSIRLTPTASDATMSIRIMGTPVGSGEVSGPVALIAGLNTIEISVTPQSGAAKTYTLAVTRAVPLSPVAELASLSLSAGTLSPAFSSGTYSYTAAVSNTVSAISLTPMATQAGSAIKVNGADVNNGTSSANIILSIGDNTIVTRVTAQDGTTVRTYTLNIIRAAPTQEIVNTGGNVTLNNATPQLLITSATQPVQVSVIDGTTSPTVDYGVLISAGGGTLPETSINSSVAMLNIPASTVVSSSGAIWNGILSAPAISTYDLPTPEGEISNTGLIVEIGSRESSLSFDRGVRLLLPGQAGMRVAREHAGVLTEITTVGPSDTQAAGDALPARGAFKINAGNDLVIWTKAFSRFITFTRTIDPDLANVASDKLSLTEELIKGGNSGLAEITGPLTNPLPVLGSNGSTITWVSDNPDIISHDGQTVMRPGLLSGDATINLSAIIKKGRITSTQVFTLKVLAQPNQAPALAPIANQVICYATEAQNIPIAGISPGRETYQTYNLSISSNNPNLFNDLKITPGSNGTGMISYTIKPGAVGNAIVTVTVKDNGGAANGGADTFVRSFNIQVNALPAVQLSSSATEVSKGNTAVITAAGGTSYSWQTAAGIISGQNSAELTVRPAVSTSYTVIVTNAAGCTSSQSITINVSDDYQALDAMNIMTPNGDGVNDFLIIKNLDMYPNNTLRVFDRSGRQIYMERNYANQWAGTFNGSKLAEGTYYYFLDFANGRGKVKGFVSIAH